MHKFIKILFIKTFICKQLCFLYQDYAVSYLLWNKHNYKMFAFFVLFCDTYLKRVKNKLYKVVVYMYSSSIE